MRTTCCTDEMTATLPSTEVSESLVVAATAEAIAELSEAFVATISKTMTTLPPESPSRID